MKTQLRTLWIPSTIAPAKPKVHTVLPAYLIERPEEKGVRIEDGRTRWCYSRTPCVRILLDRPWYSSGEGERLGLVLWPPKLREISQDDSGPDNLLNGNVPRSVLHQFDATQTSDVMKLDDFQDEDLGAGGKFTTRWGADPIRKNYTPIGPFLPRNALIDLTNNGAGYESSIAVPLDDLRKREEDAAAGKPLDRVV
jgi:hypothetical protein